MKKFFIDFTKEIIISLLMVVLGTIGWSNIITIKFINILLIHLSLIFLILFIYSLLSNKKNNRRKIIKKLYKNNRDEATILYIFSKENKIELKDSYFHRKHIINKLIDRKLVKTIKHKNEKYYKIDIELLDAANKFFEKCNQEELDKKIIEEYDFLKKGGIIVQL